MTFAAVVPVKGLDHAKSRLAGVLNDRQRQELAGFLLDDTIRALAGCSTIDQVLVVTGNEEVRRRVEAGGAQVIPEQPVPEQPVPERTVPEPIVPERAFAATHSPANDSTDGRSATPLNRALELGRLAAVDAGATALLTLPIDLVLLPGVNLASIIEDLTFYDPPGIWIATDDRQDGTNLLLQAPPSAIGFEYGSQSFARHRDAALHAGVKVHELEITPLQWDLDNPDDPNRLSEALRGCAEAGECLRAAFEAARVQGTALPFLLETDWGTPLRAAL